MKSCFVLSFYDCFIGIFCHEPKDAPCATFRECYDYGYVDGTSTDIENVIAELRPIFLDESYNIITKNCNNFSDALLKRLVNRSIPGFVNRVANIGSVFSCCLTPCLTDEPAPVSQHRLRPLPEPAHEYSNGG